MVLGKWILGSAVVLMTGSMLVAADEPAVPATQPTKAMHIRRLTEPWAMLKSLTPEQINQIEKIHGDALEQTKKIDQKEEDDITALLTDDQKAELKVDQDKLKTERKDRAKKKRAATTEPAA